MDQFSTVLWVTGFWVAGVVIELLRELQMQTDRESLGYNFLSSVSFTGWEGHRVGSSARESSGNCSFKLL